MPNYTTLKLKQNYVMHVSVALVVVVAMLVSGFFIFQYMNLKKSLINGKTASEAEVKALVAKVGTLIELPKGELPTVATVTDPAQLTSQPFFSAAKIGDKVLVYLNARKGILYRPDANKIINVSPININKQAVTPTPGQFQQAADETGGRVAGEQTRVLRVAIYNGTTASGLASKFEQELKSKVTDVTFNIVNRNNAAKTNYTLTQVIDLKGNLDEQVLKIAAAMNGENARLPAGEKKPPVDADILIIIGNDYSKASEPTTAVIPPAEEAPATQITP